MGESIGNVDLNSRYGTLLELLSYDGDEEAEDEQELLYSSKDFATAVEGANLDLDTEVRDGDEEGEKCTVKRFFF